MEVLGNHFAWFGTTRPFDTLTQSFVETENGALNVHHYRFSPDRSTFIVECDDDTFRLGISLPSVKKEVLGSAGRFSRDVLQPAPR
ncbi:hypothetical protein ACOJBO_07860 [Rhizobium beringeri]